MSPANSREAAMVELLDRAERRVAALEARLAKIENSEPALPVASVPAAATTAAVPVLGSVTLEEVSSRRGLFKVAGAVASAAVAHSLLSAAPAAAADGGNVVIGQANASTTETALTKSSNGAAAFIATNGSTTGLADGLKGVSNAALGAGVAGSSTSGYGIYGSTSEGYAVYSNGRLGLGQHLSSPGLPTAGNYELGDLMRDNVGNMFVCVGAGSAALNAVTPAVFRKVAGPATAGQLHLLASPLRAYDSRPGSYGGFSGDGPITSGVDRTVSLAMGKSSAVSPASVAVPSGATGAWINLAVVETVAGGFLTVYSNAIAWPGTANINWYATGQVLSTSTVSAVDSLQRVKVRGGGQSAQFVIDVLGYFV